LPSVVPGDICAKAVFVFTSSTFDAKVVIPLLETYSKLLDIAVSPVSHETVAKYGEVLSVAIF
jgi:hypothetical protein